MIDKIIAFVKKYKIYFISGGLVMAIILFSYLSIGRISDRYFSKEENPDTKTNKKQAEKYENIAMALDQYINQPHINWGLYLEPVKVKGIYVSGWIAGTKHRFNQLVELVNTTELNAMVIDVKEDKGKLTYNSNVALAKEVGAPVNMVGDIEQLMLTLKQNNIFPIARDRKSVV